MTPPESVEGEELSFTPEQWAFLRRMNHDLRTPLMTIMGSCEMLQEGVYGEIPPKQQRVVERILRNSHRVQDSLMRAMSYIRLKSGALTLSCDSIALVDLLNSLIIEQRNRIGERALSVDLMATPQLPTTVIGDRDQLAFIIRELLTNARNFTPQGRVTVEILPDNDHWILAVQDTGIGILADELPNVYVPFWRGGNSKTWAPDGYGLGLTIVRALVELMHGAIVIESRATEGTRVTVRLPRVGPTPGVASVASPGHNVPLQEE